MEFLARVFLQTALDEENPLKRQFDVFFVKQEQFFLYALSMRGCTQVTSLIPVCQACAIRVSWEPCQYPRGTSFF